MNLKPSEILRRAREIEKNFETPDDAIRSIGRGAKSMSEIRVVSNTTVYFWDAEWDWDRAIVLALFDEAKAVVDSGIVDSFEIALATIRMTLPEQVAVVALAVRKGIEISDLKRWGLKE